MAKEQRDNSGTFGANKKKTEPNHPDVTGSVMIDGVAYWMNAWRKEGDNGVFYSASFRPKEQRSGGGEQRQRSAPPPPDDEIPF